MIRSDRASLSIHSDDHSVADISALLAMEPDHAGDIGDLTRAGRAGRVVAPEAFRYQSTFWSITEHDDGGASDDETGTVALRRLVRRLIPHAAALTAIRESGQTLIWWSGDSDSAQGGFVWDAELLHGLSVLGCDLYGTAYLDDEGHNS